MARFNYSATQTLTLTLVLSFDNATDLGTALDTIVPLMDSATDAAQAQIAAGSSPGVTVSLVPGAWKTDITVPLIGPRGV